MAALAPFAVQIRSIIEMGETVLVQVEARIPRLAPLTRRLKNLLDAWHEYSRGITRLLVSVTVGVGFHGLVILMHHFIGSELGLPLSIADWCWVYALSAFIVLFPATIGGVGVREGSYAALLALYGVSLEDALAVSFAIFGYVIVEEIIGGIDDIVRRQNLPE